MWQSSTVCVEAWRLAWPRGVALHTPVRRPAQSVPGAPGFRFRFRAVPFIIYVIVLGLRGFFPFEFRFGFLRLHLFTFIFVFSDFIRPAHGTAVRTGDHTCGARPARACSALRQDLARERDQKEMRLSRRKHNATRVSPSLAHAKLAYEQCTTLAEVYYMSVALKSTTDRTEPHSGGRLSKSETSLRSSRFSLKTFVVYWPSTILVTRRQPVPDDPSSSASSPLSCSSDRTKRSPPSTPPFSEFGFRRNVSSRPQSLSAQEGSNTR